MDGRPRGFPETDQELLERDRLEDLCARYWRPVCHYLRVSRGCSREDSKDLTQAFFLWLLEGTTLERYDAGRGSFRTFLKLLLGRFAEHQERALQRLKRGGGRRRLALDEALPDPRSADPSAAFDEAWRTQIVADATERVRRHLESRGRGRQFAVFQAHALASPDRRPTYGEIAARMSLKVSDVRNHLVAVREAIRSEIRAELARLTRGDAELAREWNDLLGA
jgi:DNA-directed RNA polymerase specialized sigma24 family protein